MMKFLALLIVLIGLPAQAHAITLKTPDENVQCSALIVGDGFSLTCVILAVDPDVDLKVPLHDGCTQTWGRHFEMRADGEVTLRCVPPPVPMDGAMEMSTSSPALLHGIRCTAGYDTLFCMNLDRLGFFIGARHIHVF